ncbi:MAG: hypothetical protein RL036_567 [Actinomycetota bacterium]|jgi:hypothetical protein
MIATRGQLPNNSDLAGLEVHGQVAGDAVVSGGSAALYGQVGGNLTVQQGAQVVVYGQICGDLIVQGQVKLLGWVIGDVIELDGGSFEYLPGSKIGTA